MQGMISLKGEKLKRQYMHEQGLGVKIVYVVDLKMDIIITFSTSRS